MKTKLLSLWVALLATTALWAYDFQSGDLYYNITDATDLTVEVTYEVWDEDGTMNNYAGLTTATIPATVTYNSTTYSVTSIGSYAFSNCTGLSSIMIPNSVISIGYSAFSGCSGLTSVTIGNSVTSIGQSAFSGCSGLTSVTIGNSVTSIGRYAFQKCTSLTAITIPNSVTSIGDYAFSGCTGLTSITIGNSVTSIGYSAFSGCTGLTSITIPNSVSSIGSWAFSGCTGLTSIVVESGNTVYDSRENCNAIIETATNALIQGCNTTVIPNNIITIGEDAFYGCQGLTAITIPNSVTSIGWGAFQVCTRLTSITIPNSVTSIGDYAFSGCTGLTSVSIGNSVTSIGRYAFQKCTSLTAITIPNSVTSIGWGAFLGCTGLTSITIPNSVTSIGESAFEGCTGLTSITIPNSVTSIGSYAFSNCTGLTSITIPNSVTSIGESAFEGCTGLTSIVWKAKKYPGWMPSHAPFSGIETNITSVILGEEVEYIPAYLCLGMSNLTAIIIPNSVANIGNFAFSNCKGLTSVYVLAETPPTIGTSTFNNVSTDIAVYVPCGTKDAYQEATTWRRFTNYIETPPYILTITAQDETMGSVRITQQATCTDNTAVIEATANEGYRFVQWSDGNTDNPRTIIVDEDITLTAQFVSLTAINNPSVDDITTPRKLFRNGQVLILRNDKTYTLTGVKVE